MLCTNAINTSNTIRTQTGPAERHSSGLDSNSCYYVNCSLISSSALREAQAMTADVFADVLFKNIFSDFPQTN